MKHLFKNILVLAVMFGTFTSFGTESIKISSNSTFKITKGDLISVTDYSGKTIYSGRTKYTGDLKSLYNFTNLEDGLYSIEIEKDFEILSKTIEVKNHLVTFLESASETFFKPAIKLEKARLLVTQSLFKEETIEIEIYYKDDLILSEALIANPTLKRVYKLDETIKGSYTAIIRVNDRGDIENLEF